jgi:hypothetical protein
VGAQLSSHELLGLELMMTYFGSIDHKKKTYYEFGEKAIQIGGEIQDDRQTRMFHNSINFHLNHLKLRI